MCDLSFQEDRLLVVELTSHCDETTARLGREARKESYTFEATHFGFTMLAFIFGCDMAQL